MTKTIYVAKLSLKKLYKNTGKSLIVEHEKKYWTIFL